MPADHNQGAAPSTASVGAEVAEADARLRLSQSEREPMNQLLQQASDAAQALEKAESANALLKDAERRRREAEAEAEDAKSKLAAAAPHAAAHRMTRAKAPPHATHARDTRSRREADSTIHRTRSRPERTPDRYTFEIVVLRKVDGLGQVKFPAIK